jgi:hypothetical protein
MEAIERIKGYCCEVTQGQWNEFVFCLHKSGINTMGKKWDINWPIVFIGCRGLLDRHETIKDAEINNLSLIPYPDYLAKLKGEEKWEPKAGEMVEVSVLGETWWEREFIAVSKNRYIAWGANGCPTGYGYCRPCSYRPTITRAEAESILNKRIID